MSKHSYFMHFTTPHDAPKHPLATIWLFWCSPSFAFHSFSASTAYSSYPIIVNEILKFHLFSHCKSRWNVRCNMHILMPRENCNLDYEILISCWLIVVVMRVVVAHFGNVRKLRILEFWNLKMKCPTKIIAQKKVCKEMLQCWKCPSESGNEIFFT